MNTTPTYDPRFVQVLREHCQDLAEVVILHPSRRQEILGTIIESAEITARFASPINRHAFQQKVLVEIVTQVDGTVTSRVAQKSTPVDAKPSGSRTSRRGAAARSQR